MCDMNCLWYRLALLFIAQQNPRLVQTERLCRQQNKCEWKIEIWFGKGRKHCGKRRKCWLPAFSPFSQCFHKDLSTGSLKVVNVWSRIEIDLLEASSSHIHRKNLQHSYTDTSHLSYLFIKYILFFPFKWRHFRGGKMFAIMYVYVCNYNLVSNN